MFTSISRIIRYGFKNFWGNVWLSTATVAVMVLALMVFLGLIIFNVITSKATATIQDKIDISVYFKTSAPEDEILNIQSSLQQLSEVKSVDYISRDQALADFKTKHQNDQAIAQALSELNNNPLEASLNVKAKNPSQYADIADYLNSPNFSQYIDTISYAQNQVVINRLTKIIQTADRGGLLLTILLAIIAGLVVFNTIRLAIYSSRDEITIMRLVGASNALVRGPFVVEGMVSGVIAAILSILLTAPLIYFISPYINVFIGDLNIFQYFYTHIFGLLFYQVLFGIAIGSFSAFFSVRRYLTD